MDRHLQDHNIFDDTGVAGRRKVVVGATWCLGISGRKIEQQKKGNIEVSKGRGRTLGTGYHRKIKIPDDCEKVRSRGQIYQHATEERCEAGDRRCSR